MNSKEIYNNKMTEHELVKGQQLDINEIIKQQDGPPRKLTKISRQQQKQHQQRQHTNINKNNIKSSELVNAIKANYAVTQKQKFYKLFQIQLNFIQKLFEVEDRKISCLCCEVYSKLWCCFFRKARTIEQTLYDEFEQYNPGFYRAYMKLKKKQRFEYYNNILDLICFIENIYENTFQQLRKKTESGLVNQHKFRKKILKKCMEKFIHQSIYELHYSFSQKTLENNVIYLENKIFQVNIGYSSSLGTQWVVVRARFRKQKLEACREMYQFKEVNLGKLLQIDLRNYIVRESGDRTYPLRRPLVLEHIYESQDPIENWFKLIFLPNAQEDQKEKIKDFQRYVREYASIGLIEKVVRNIDNNKNIGKEYLVSHERKSHHKNGNSMIVNSIGRMCSKENLHVGEATSSEEDNVFDLEERKLELERKSSLKSSNIQKVISALKVLLQKKKKQREKEFRFKKMINDTAILNSHKSQETIRILADLQKKKNKQATFDISKMRKLTLESQNPQTRFIKQEQMLQIENNIMSPKGKQQKNISEADFNLKMNKVSEEDDFPSEQFERANISIIHKTHSMDSGSCFHSLQDNP